MELSVSWVVVGLSIEEEGQEGNCEARPSQSRCWKCRELCALVRFRACHSVGLESWLNQERAVSSLAV